METQLPDILKDLANQINKTPAGKNAVLTDVVDTSKFDIGIGTYSDDLVLAEDGKTLTWNIGDIPEEEQTVTIKVKAKDGIYGKDIPTNTNVYLNYTNPKDNSSVTIPESQIGRPTVTIPDTRPRYTVTYTDGVPDEVVFADQTTSNLLAGDKTPAFSGTPTRTGYNFAGWSPEVEDKVTPPESGNTITYVAQWTARTDLSYTVNYLEKGTNTVLQTAKVTGNQTFGTIITAANEVVTITGFTFDNADPASLTIGTGQNVINLYYTRNSYNVTYQYNGTVPTGASALPAGGTYKFGETVSVADAATAPGYMFIGWDSGDVTIDPASNNFTMPAKNVTITGTWELDTWSDKDDSIEDGDGIPDKYQVAVKYVSEDTVKGTVDPKLEVLTIYGDDGTTPATSGTVTAAGSTATAKSDYFFNKWTKAVNKGSEADTELTAATGSIPLENVNGLDVITFTAYFTQKDTSVEVTKTVSAITTPDGKGYDSLTTAKVGDTITWTITVENTGNVEQTFTLEDILSNGVSLPVADSTSAEVTTITLAAGKSADFTVTYVVQLIDSGTTLTNMAVLKEDGKEKDNDNSEGVKIDPAVIVNKTVDKTTASVGDTLTYTITVTNNASVVLNNIVITDAMLGMTGNKAFTIPTLAVGGTWSETYTYTVKSSDAGKKLVNTAIASAEDGKELDRDSTDETAIRVPIKPINPGQPALNTDDHVAYIIGYADGTVKPNNNITRAEVATIFFRLLTDDSRAAFWSQTNSYSDVSLNNWFNNAVSTLSNAGIISGYPNGTFNPNASITRAEFAAIATRFSNATYTGSCSFSDVPANHWAANAIALAEDLGWINGYSDGTFRPNQPITRAEAMTLINRVLERAVDRDHMLLTMVTWSDNQPGSWYYEAVQEATNSHTYSRTGIYVPSQSFCYENWLKVLEAPDWAALEKAWSTANSQ